MEESGTDPGAGGRCTSPCMPDIKLDWDAVLVRLIEAYDLNDPVITDFEWPLREAA
jgi:hypothetical protein